jgi:hypothetical protein
MGTEDVSAVGTCLTLLICLLIDKICIGHRSACSDFAGFTLTMRKGRCRRRWARHIVLPNLATSTRAHRLPDGDCADVARFSDIAGSLATRVNGSFRAGYFGAASLVLVKAHWRDSN